MSLSVKMKKNRPDLLCLGGGYESLPILQRVHELGFNPIVIDENRYCPGFEWVGDKGETWLANCYGWQSVRIRTQKKLRWSGSIHTFYSIKGIMCCAVDAPDVQAGVAEMLGLPTIGRSRAELASNKYLQYTWLRDHNLPVPQSKLVNINFTHDDAIGYDLIKPVASRGARGVSRYTPENFKERLIEAVWESAPGQKNAIVQKWINGVQLSTESVIRNGHVEFTAVALRNYDRLGEFSPYVIEDGCEAPYHLPPAIFQNLNSLLLRACASMGWDNLTVKGDLILDHDVLYIIELAPRLSGGYLCSHIIPLAYNFDLVKEAIYLATGKKSRGEEPERNKFVCQRYIFPRPEWYGKSIDYLPPIPEDSHLGLFTYHRRIGDRVDRVKSHAGRLGQCITFGNTQTQARELCESVIESVTNQVKVK